MLTNECKYALRAVLYLAENSNPEKRFGAIEIAEHLNIPTPFLAKILQKLSREKIISSNKGPKGGFYLTEEEKQYNISELVKSIDGLGAFTNCFLGFPVCNENNPCALHHLVAPFRDDLNAKFLNKSVVEFLTDLRQGNNTVSFN